MIPTSDARALNVLLSRNIPYGFEMNMRKREQSSISDGDSTPPPRAKSTPGPRTAQRSSTFLWLFRLLLEVQSPHS